MRRAAKERSTAASDALVKSLRKELEAAKAESAPAVDGAAVAALREENAALRRQLAERPAAASSDELTGVTGQDVQCDGDARAQAQRTVLDTEPWRGGRALESALLSDGRADYLFVLAFRCATSAYLLANANDLAPNGMAWNDLFAATGTSVESFCADVVNTMGEDARGEVLSALPLALGLSVRTQPLSARRDHGGRFVHPEDFGEPRADGAFDACLLLRPGHYDILYARDPRRGDSME